MPPRAGTSPDDGATPHRGRRPVAAYLWCGSSDTSLVEDCRSELGSFAARLGLPWPSFFEDGGLPARATPPALACLLELVAVDVFQAVLIPNRFVLAPGAGYGTTPGMEFPAAIVAAADGVDCRIIEFSPAE
ncbi:hypothetical protein [Kitasatospora indigofera]|uniref:hypothetical protein n=1 Tax=Kitasatospora indigofera TaxID=67307 RepID=UPI003244EAE5